MKNLKKIIVASVVFVAMGCSKDDNVASPVKMPSAKIVVANPNELIIPDGTSSVLPGLAENAVEVTNEGIISDPIKVYVRLDMQHTWAGDLVIQIFAPSGESCTLVKRAFSGTNDVSSDFIAGNIITFNAAASGMLVVVDGKIPEGVYLPTGFSEAAPTTILLGDLSTFFTGKNIHGVWKLKVGDYSQFDTGKINSWNLEFDTGALQ